MDTDKGCPLLSLNILKYEDINDHNKKYISQYHKAAGLSKKVFDSLQWETDFNIFRSANQNRLTLRI